VKAIPVALFLLVFTSVLPFRAQAQSGPPALCKPCLFYAGDFDPTGFYSAAFPDENTFVYDNVKTYGAITIPRNHEVLVEGILFQVVFSGEDKLDPTETPWEIRTGISEGSGGALIASGQAFAHIQATGRFGDGPEYSVALKVNPPVLLGAGTFWFNLTPQCRNKHDPACGSSQYSVSNTTLETNNFHGALQPTGQIFVNSESLNYPYTWENWCDLTNQQACARLSFGLMGKIN
jgi:hypothetical protein